jgi:hypothetical protein
MKIVKFAMMVIGMFVIMSSGKVANATLCVKYNIGGWSHYYGNLPASYDDGSSSLVSASSLSPTNGLFIPGNSNMGGTGKFWFAGWNAADSTSSPAIQFSIMASQSISLGTMSYSWFSGNWSDRWFGPNYLDVRASKDNWATSQIISGHYTWSYYPDSGYSYNFTDDLSPLGILNPGETVSIRFFGRPFGTYATGGDAAGFIHTASYEQDLTVNFTPIPEPATLTLLTLGGLVLRRKHKI